MRTLNDVAAAMAARGFHLTDDGRAIFADVPLEHVERMLGQAAKDVEREEELAQLRAGAQASVPSYRGVWNAARAYAHGDYVTDKGALWHANESSAGQRPGTSRAWQLAVKAGRAHELVP
jgi:hypothetical protein